MDRYRGGTMYTGGKQQKTTKQTTKEKLIHRKKTTKQQTKDNKKTTKEK